jgi:predicted Zn-dependent protease
MTTSDTLVTQTAGEATTHDPCSCSAWRPTRRLFTGLLAAGAGAAVAPAWANLPECKRSGFTKAVPAGQVEDSATQQYRQMLQQYSGKRALAPMDHPQLKRLRYMAERMIPFAPQCNERARDWKWEVNLIGSPEVNAFCMPGGKIAFYTGILEQLQLSDDETAQIMGHEIAHALREHARARMGKGAATSIGAGLLSQVLGLGELGRTVTNYGAELLTLKFSRDDETEADLVGLELAARGGYDPQAGVSLWRKMQSASKGAPPQWLSTHPAGATRIADIEKTLPQVQPLFEKARRN